MLLLLSLSLSYCFYNIVFITLSITLFPDDTVDVDEYGQPRDHYPYENHDDKVENMMLTV